MKTRNLFQAITFVAICGLALSARATLVVNDTWTDGTRTDPAAPVYSEYGVDGDADGSIESAWFVGGSGTLGAQVGSMLMSNATTSATYTTYFTPEATPVTLVNAGDSMKVTWVFTPHGVNTSNTSVGGLPFAVVNSPSASRLTVDGSPGSAIYAGYSMAMNMGNTIKSANPFLLREWATPGASSALLSSSGAWAGLTSGGYSSPILSGYVDNQSYTFTMQFTLLSGGDLQISSSMTGGTLNGGAGFSLVYTDSTPNSLTFDTVAIRPTTIGSTATSFDTTLFQVDGPITIPEPSTLALVGAGLSLMFAMIRRRRS